MEGIFKNVNSLYVSPSVAELEIANEGILCASGTERLDENLGAWSTNFNKDDLDL